MPDQAVLCEVRDGIAIVSLNRPAQLNAFAGDMREQLIERLDEIAARGDVRVLVITGNGRTLAECLAVEHEAQRACWSSPDVAEGLQAAVTSDRRSSAFSLLRVRRLADGQLALARL